MVEENDIRKIVGMEEMLSIVGSYGKFQKLINFIFCVMTLQAGIHLMIIYFAADTPSWKCVTNSSVCIYNTTFPSGDRKRCEWPRGEWEYTKPREYSIVTQWGIDCNTEWLKDLSASIFFFGWLIGAPILGWLADNYGRRRVLLHIMNAIIVIGFVTAFTPNIHLFVVCRFVIGFFGSGTYPQMSILVMELVGSEYRPFAGILIYIFVGVGSGIVGLKAWFIREWKLLYIVSSAPYVFILLFYMVIPRSLHFVYAKKGTKEAMSIFHHLAKWNRREIPPEVYIAAPVDTQVKTRPLELLRTRKLAVITFIQSLYAFLYGVGYFALYFAAGDIGGSIYRDFLIVTVSDIPLSLSGIYFSTRIGRKKTVLSLSILSFCTCVGLALTPPNQFTVRIVFGMIGKGGIGAAMNTLANWGAQLYPTKYRSEAMGIIFTFARLGSICAPWINTEFAKLGEGLNFIFVSVTSFISCVLLCFLPERNEDVENANNLRSVNNAIELRNTDTNVASHDNVIAAMETQESTYGGNDDQ